MRTTLLIHPDELSERWIRRASSLGYTGIALHPVGGSAAADALKDLLSKLETDDFRHLIDLARDSGLTVEYELHAAGFLYPRELFGQKPESFRMNAEGVRTSDWNFCFSDPGAMDLVLRRAKELAKKLYRSEKRFYFWADDARDCFCRCPACAGLTPSDQNLMLANALCASIREVIPDACVAYLAYADTMETPKSVRPAEGVFLEYAPFDRDMHKPVREQQKSKAGDIRELLGFFGMENAKVLDYWMDNSYFSGWQKPPKKYTPDIEVIRSDLDFYRSLGFRSVSSFACYLGEDYVSLYGEPEIPDLGAL